MKFSVNLSVYYENENSLYVTGIASITINYRDVEKKFAIKMIETDYGATHESHYESVYNQILKQFGWDDNSRLEGLLSNTSDTLYEMIAFYSE